MYGELRVPFLPNVSGVPRNMLTFYFNSWLQAALSSSPDDEDAMKAIDLLYDTALVSSGYTVSSHTISLLR